MKIAALALASALAALAGSAQPVFAQNTGQNDQNQYNNQDQYNDQDQNNQDQYDQSGMSGQNQNEDMNDESSTTGQNMNGNNNSNGNNQASQFRNPNNNNSNNNNWRNNRMGSNDNGRGWGHHHWRMEGRMGPMWHHRMMGMMRPQGARFSFGNGRARMNVQCPPNEPVQTCVNAATELLDKIASLRNHMGPNQSGQNGTNGQGLSGSSNLNKNDESDTGTNSLTTPGASMPNATQPPTSNDSSDKQ